ncbi:MAG TPA: hypothetical protein VJM33_00360 [Microthrixaceae bacterium]|nr:hypothetical protein [Microthrixaceae bacterium]
MSPRRRFLTWLRTADAPVPRVVRASRRELARVGARRRHGTITAHMEAVVAEANRATTGSGFPDRHRPRS